MATTISITFKLRFCDNKDLHHYLGSKFTEFSSTNILYVLNFEIIYFAKNSAHVYSHLLLYILDKQILIS